MSKIIQLDAHLANLIAAGEVVERPASVVKELVENAVDAGAKNITVELQNGGMRLLRVTDDGCGMVPEDAALAFSRHATSKLRTKEDLEAIGTLGFRGEALAATAAVSKVDLLTRTEEASEGISLHLEAGKLLSREPAGCPVGTTILVRDLFYNTPARMKFMKRDSVEASAAAAVVQRQALAYPGIAFRLIKDGEVQLRTAGDGDLQAAVYSVLGRQTAMEMIPVQSSWERISVSGYVTRPTATRGTRSYQLFYVNYRPIRSKLLTAALEEAYRNQIMTGRFPACVLNLTMPLTAVDVNVHPAKTEVKFLNEREIFDCVHYGVLGALKQASGQVAMELKDPDTDQSLPLGGKVPPKGADEGFQPQPNPAFFQTMTAEEYRSSADKQADGKSASRSRMPVHTMTRWEYEQMSRVLEKAPKTVPSQTLQQAVREQRLHDRVHLPVPEEAAGSGQPAAGDGGSDAAEERLLPEVPELPAEADKSSPMDTTAPMGEADRPAAEGGLLPDVPDPQLSVFAPSDAPAFRFVGEVFRTYLLAEQEGSLILIDKHAAHERINFERLLAQGTRILGQTLLQPQTCRLDREEAALLLEHRELLLTLGYDIDDLGEGDLLLRQIPSDLPVSDAAAALSELAGHLADGRLDTPQRLREEALHTIACKAAIKAGYRTDPVEQERLVAQVLTREDLKYCPHGRPICVVLTKKQLEKQFKRIV